MKLEISNYASNLGLSCFNVINEESIPDSTLQALIGFDSHKEIELNRMLLLNELKLSSTVQLFRFSADREYAIMTIEPQNSERIYTDDQVSFHIDTELYAFGLLITTASSLL